MNTRALIAATLCGVAILGTGCRPLLRASTRSSRGSYNQRNEVKPEDLRIQVADLDAATVKLLNQHRAKWSEFVQRYNATDVTGAEQVVAVVSGFNNAHWSEKPKPEDMVEPLGVAIGDVLKADGHVGWVIAEGDTVCLCSSNGKVAVAATDIADTWLSTKASPLDQLRKDVAKAVKETTGEPKLIGFVEERKYEPQLR